MRSGAWSHSARPLLPGLGRLRREFRHAHAFACCLSRIDPRLEIGWREVGKCQQQIAEIAFRIDTDGRHAVDGGFFEQREAQPGLAAAGHAHADRVSGQVPGIVENQLVLELAGGRVEFTTQVERA